MGVVVHLHLNTLENYKDFDMSLGKLGNIPVATFANRSMTIKNWHLNGQSILSVRSLDSALCLLP